jgi:hypothetical protein
LFEKLRIAINAINVIATAIANIGSGMTTLVSTKLDMTELSSIVIVDILKLYSVI